MKNVKEVVVNRGVISLSNGESYPVDYHIKYKITKNNIKILNSYVIKDKNIMLEALIDILSDDEFSDTRDRTIEQYLREWRAHNIMYRIPLKYFKKHCGDADLTNGESKFRLFVYDILGRL